ncbi:MAG: tetratricopeptide repeat protein, partial [Promethearchaeota archaeon]
MDIKKQKLKHILRVTISSYDKAIKNDPNNHILWYNMGNSFNQLEEPQKAINCYEKAVEIFPKFKDGWLKLGQSY